MGGPIDLTTVLGHQILGIEVTWWIKFYWNNICVCARKLLTVHRLPWHYRKIPGQRFFPNYFNASKNTIKTQNQPTLAYLGVYNILWAIFWAPSSSITNNLWETEDEWTKKCYRLSPNFVSNRTFDCTQYCTVNGVIL